MNKKVLICDDEPFILESVKHVVKREGYETITAEDGLKGLDLARQEIPNLMILDVMMPGKTGYEVCKLIKSDSSTKDIFVIILTARGQELDEKLGLEAGADEYMTKPFSPRKLRQRLHEILDQD